MWKFTITFLLAYCIFLPAQVYLTLNASSDTQLDSLCTKDVSYIITKQSLSNFYYKYYWREGSTYKYATTGGSITANTLLSYPLSTGSDSYLYTGGISSSYFVFTFVKKTGVTPKGCVFTLNYAPVQITSATAADYTYGKKINVTFSANKPAEQYAYVVYSCDNYLTRKIAQITNADNKTTGSVNITSDNYSNSPNYKFYVMISPLPLSTLNGYTDIYDIEACTIAFNNVLGVNSPLPVELVSFTGNFKAGKTVLQWTTQTETANYGFCVERSFDNLNWDSTSFIPGNVNSNSEKYYKYEEPFPCPFRAYYRLKQIDTDGKFIYSGVIEITRNEIASGFSLLQNFPNPFNPNTNIEFSTSENMQINLTVYNILGEKTAVLYNGNAEAGKAYSVSFNGANLPSGVYFYRLTTPKGITAKKMILNK